jgi:hypothetical protein
LLLALWAFKTRYDQVLRVLETATPAELRMAIDLIRHAEEFRERARSLEYAMEQATAISQQMQRGLELERQQLATLHEEHRQQVQLNEMTPEQTTAVVHLLARHQARSERRAVWTNIVIGIVFLILGVLAPALITTDTLREQLRLWFHLG